MLSASTQAKYIPFPQYMPEQVRDNSNHNIGDSNNSQGQMDLQGYSWVRSVEHVGSGPQDNRYPVIEDNFRDMYHSAVVPTKHYDEYMQPLDQGSHAQPQQLQQLQQDQLHLLHHQLLPQQLQQQNFLPQQQHILAPQNMQQQQPQQHPMIYQQQIIQQQQQQVPQQQQQQPQQQIQVQVQQQQHQQKHQQHYYHFTSPLQLGGQITPGNPIPGVPLSGPAHESMHLAQSEQMHPEMAGLKTQVPKMQSPYTNLIHLSQPQSPFQYQAHAPHNLPHSLQPIMPPLTDAYPLHNDNSPLLQGKTYQQGYELDPQTNQTRRTLLRCPVRDCPWNQRKIRRAELRKHCFETHLNKGKIARGIDPETADLISLLSYKCNVPNCGKHYSRSDSLKRHIKLIHNRSTSRFNKKLRDRALSEDAKLI